MPLIDFIFSIDSLVAASQSVILMGIALGFLRLLDICLRGSSKIIGFFTVVIIIILFIIIGGLATHGAEILIRHLLG